MLFSSGESAEAENKFSMTQQMHVELSDSLQAGHSNWVNKPD
jgi:hypothetical protein